MSQRSLLGAITALGGLALCAVAVPAAGQTAIGPGAAAEIEMTVRGGDGLEAVRVTRFTPRMAAVEALESVAPVGAPHQVMGLSAAWDDPLRRLFGVDATLALSGAVATDPERSEAGAGIALGATVSTMGVDLSGRFVRPDGAGDEAVSFGAATAVGGWTVGGAISVETDADGGTGAQLGASWRAAPGLRVGGGIDISSDDHDGGDARRGGLPGGGTVGAGVSVRLNF